MLTSRGDFIGRGIADPENGVVRLLYAGPCRAAGPGPPPAARSGGRSNFAGRWASSTDDPVAGWSTPKPLPGGEAILAARQAILEAHPARYAAMLEEGAELLHATGGLAREMAGVDLNGGGSTHDDCVELGKDGNRIPAAETGGERVHHLVGGCVCFPSSWDCVKSSDIPSKPSMRPVPTVNETRRRRSPAFWPHQAGGGVGTMELGHGGRDAWNHHPALAIRGWMPVPPRGPGSGLSIRRSGRSMSAADCSSPSAFP